MQRQEKFAKTKKHCAKATNKVRKKLKKLKTTKQMAVVIIKHNNNRTVLSKRRWCIKQEIEVYKKILGTRIKRKKYKYRSYMHYAWSCIIADFCIKKKI